MQRQTAEFCILGFYACASTVVSGGSSMSGASRRAPASARAAVSLQLKGDTDVSQAWWGSVLLSHP